MQPHVSQEHHRLLSTGSPHATSMPICPNCGHRLMRTHRTTIQKLLFREALRCSHCGFRRKRLHPVIDVDRLFVFSRYTRCIRCGSTNIQRLSERDRIDSMSNHLFSRLFQLTAAPLKKCPSCRLQYYDWRPPVRK